ncbi:MerR family transcriptional regulator [Pseudonocardia benzenivorans]
MTGLTIGELARRSGVSARTIRFWSDEGVLPETDRSAAGYRRYDASAVARLDLVRTLRELGLGLDAVRAVLDRTRGVDEVAAAHVRAIDDRIRALRTQRAICTLLARGDHTEGDGTDERPGHTVRRAAAAADRRVRGRDLRRHGSRRARIGHRDRHAQSAR